MCTPPHFHLFIIFPSHACTPFLHDCVALSIISLHHSFSHPAFSCSSAPRHDNLSAWSRFIPVEVNSQSQPTWSHADPVVKQIPVTHNNNTSASVGRAFFVQYQLPQSSWTRLARRKSTMGPRAKRKTARKSAVSQTNSDYEMAESSPSRPTNKRRKVSILIVPARTFKLIVAAERQSS